MHLERGHARQCELTILAKLASAISDLKFNFIAINDEANVQDILKMVMT